MLQPNKSIPSALSQGSGYFGLCSPPPTNFPRVRHWELSWSDAVDSVDRPHPQGWISVVHSVRYVFIFLRTQLDKPKTKGFQFGQWGGMQVGFSSTLSLTDTEVFPHGLMKMARCGQDCAPKAPHFFGFCWFQDTCHRPRATTKRCTPMIPWYRAAQNNHHISSVPPYPSACLLRTAVGPKSGSTSSHLTHTKPTKFWLRHNLH